MDDKNVGPSNLKFRGVNGWQDLFVDPAAKSDAWIVAKQLNMVNGGHILGIDGGMGAMHLHDIGSNRIGMRAIHQLPQASAVVWVDRVVGIHPKQPLPRCVS